MSADAITLEVVRSRLELIAEQARFTMIRSAYSTIVKEAGDVAAALFDRDGILIAQAAGVPILLGATVPAMASVLAQYPVEEMEDGDIYLLNDPYQGGTHIPDLITIAPVLIESKRVGFVCVVAHHVDLGGQTIGSLPVDATDIFQEGLRLPPIRLCRRKVMDETVRRILLANTRFPSELIGDIEAQISACLIGGDGLRQLAAVHGVEALYECTRELVARSETLTRKALSALTAGRFSFADFMDNDGVALHQNLRIEVAAEVAEDGLTFDFAGTTQQVAGPFNASPSTVLAAAYYVLRCVTGSAIPSNGGCFRVIKLNLPEATLVNPKMPAAVNARSMSFGIIVDVLFGALAQAAPDKIPAASYDYPNVTFGGVDPMTDRSFVVNETACGGLGARPYADGIDVFRSKAGNSLNTPIEALETDTPLRVLRFGLRPDSGGAGQYRGGLGCSKIFSLLRGEIVVSHRGDRHRNPPYGLSGGRSGARSVSFVEKRDGTKLEIPSKLVFSMSPGDTLHFHTAGGGGFGDPRLRQTCAIREDLLNGKITSLSAFENYGFEEIEGAHDEKSQ